MKRINKILALLFAVILFFLPGCNAKGQTQETGSQASENRREETDIPGEADLSVIREGRSEYVIVCDYQDTVGKRFADDLWQLIYATYHVSLNIKSDRDTYKKEIQIGNCNRTSLLSVRAQCAEQDFAICAVGDSLVLYATDQGQYKRLMIALRDMVFADRAEKDLVFSAKQSFISSLNPNLSFRGSEAILMENGVSRYSIVYGEGNTDSMMYAIYLKQYLKEKLGVTLPILSDTKQAEREIVVKGANRKALRSAEAGMTGQNDFCVTVSGDSILLSATDNLNMVLAMMKLCEWCLAETDTSGTRLFEVDSYVLSRNGYDFSYQAKELCQRYQSIYNTYSSYHEDKLYNTSWLPQEAKDDQKLVVALIERMGGAVAFANGSSSVLWNGFVRKLDKQDYSRVAVIENGTVKIPAVFAETFFGKPVSADSSGYVDVGAVAAGEPAYTLYIAPMGDLAILTPPGETPFTDAATDGKYCDRMRGFFHSEVIPEPTVPVEQSRTVIEYIEYPHNVPDFKTNSYQTTYSPGIVVVEEAGKSVYYVSYEISTVMNYEELSTFTVVKKSTDGGNTWTTVVEKIPNLRWASPFENRGSVYLLGSDIDTGAAVIIRVGENGTYHKAILFKAEVVQGTSPGAVLHANGRIYKAYHIASISASEDADLMNPASWTVSNRTNTEALAQFGGEGSMVAGKDGEVYQVMHTDKPQTAYILKLSADGKTYTAAKPDTSNIVQFPTCISKTSVIYDAVSGKYLALSNICNTQNKRQRNVLALVVSEDLYTWEIAEYLLVEREMVNPLYSTTMHAFQYADFKIDGDSLAVVVREAAGYTNTYHDGNYTTFYRVENFRALLEHSTGAYPAP